MLVKRVFDLTILLVSSPVWLIVLGLLTLASTIAIGRPIFFRQQRAGINGRPFNIIKFRTMTNSRDQSGELLADKDRLTTFGRLLRDTSLDELPELVNILLGQMSLVGPRPLVIRYIERYSQGQRRRLDLLPGLTGWAQINGRNGLSWTDKFRLDVWYVDNRNLWLDLRILGLTGWKVLRREGISASGEATMPEFKGNDSQ
ncbi:sugar transferase [Verrucomicrobia bacterium]|nr:sugar transferase [Verrucomicrobiota bacterium]MDA7657492.1 sugar transferase [Verrucomicrobiota bacterium]